MHAFFGIVVLLGVIGYAWCPPPSEEALKKKISDDYYTEQKEAFAQKQAEEAAAISYANWLPEEERNEAQPSRHLGLSAFQGILGGSIAQREYCCLKQTQRDERAVQQRDWVIAREEAVLDSVYATLFNWRAHIDDTSVTKVELEDLISLLKEQKPKIMQMKAAFVTPAPSQEARQSRNIVDCQFLDGMKTLAHQCSALEAERKKRDTWVQKIVELRQEEQSSRAALHALAAQFKKVQTQKQESL